MSILASIGNLFAPPAPAAPPAPLQYGMPQNIPEKPQAQSQSGQGAGQMPQGTMDMIMKLFAGGM